MNLPEQPKNSFRIVLELSTKQRIDGILLAQLRAQTRNQKLQGISRTGYKELFKEKRIRLKGQSAVPSSLLAKGITVVDIMGFDEDICVDSAL